MIMEFSSSELYFNEVNRYLMMKRKPRTLLCFFYMQELANPTVEAPGKGYIGEYSMRVPSVDWRKKQFPTGKQARLHTFIHIKSEIQHESLNTMMRDYIWGWFLKVIFCSDSQKNYSPLNLLWSFLDNFSIDISGLFWFICCFSDFTWIKMCKIHLCFCWNF